jgi:hypothetical protein
MCGPDLMFLVSASAGSQRAADLPNKALGAHRGAASEVRALTIDHFDPVDCTVSPLKIEAVGTFSASDDTADTNVVRVSVAVNDFQIEDFDVIAPRRQPNCLEPAFAPSYPDGVAVPPAKRNFLTAELDPLAFSTIIVAVTISPLGLCL